MFSSDNKLEVFLRCPSQLRVLSDAELMVVLRSGCNDALAVLYERHGSMLLGIARERNDADAELIVKSVFEAVFRAKEQFDASQESFQPWLMKYIGREMASRGQEIMRTPR